MKLYHHSNHHRIKINALIIICLVFTFSSVIAREQFVIKPQLQVDWQRSSNFHRSETNEKTVDTYTIGPKIDLGYTTGKSFVSLSYWFKVFRYDDQDENLPGQIDADEFDYTAHNARFKAHTQATRRLRLGVDNTFLKTRDPASSDARSNAVDRFKYTLNRFSPKLNYQFGEKFGLGLKFTNLLTDYSDDAPGQGEDSTENRGNITWYYYFTPKTFFDLDYQYWERNYDQNSADYDSNQVTVNVNHQFNKLTLRAGAGYQKREFDNTIEEFDSFVWKISGTWVLPKSSVYVGFSSNLNDSGADQVSGGTYFQSTYLDVRFMHQITQKITGTLSGYYQNADYETSGREDDWWHVSLEADYLINQYFTVGLTGGLEERDSNQAGRDFDNRFFMITAGFNYDLGSR